MSSDLDVELYKSLRAEASGYVEKVPTLWLQKFLLIGAVLAFLIGQPFTNIQGFEVPLGVSAVAVLPILAMFLDAKMLEYALHARAISVFIGEHFATHKPIAAWERAMWGQAGNRTVMRLTRIRSIATWFTTVIPTIVILVAAAVVIERVLQERFPALITTVLTAGAYVGGTAWAAIVVYRIGHR
jgi:hypothetical protein